MDGIESPIDPYRRQSAKKAYTISVLESVSRDSLNPYFLRYRHVAFMPSFMFRNSRMRRLFAYIYLRLFFIVFISRLTKKFCIHTAMKYSVLCARSTLS